jgi:hypothetical protein
MVKLVCWNIDKKICAWHELISMKEKGEADVALLQEAGHPPKALKEKLEVDETMFSDPLGFRQLPLIVGLSDNVTIETYRQVRPVAELPEDAIGVSDIGTIAAAKVTPVDKPDDTFIAVSMYARWLFPHPSAAGKGIISVNSAHRIISDLATFVGNYPAPHRILAAGDLNMFYGACGKKLSVPKWERTVWDRMFALGMNFMGPQQPNGRPPEPEIVPDDVPADTKNVPTFYQKKNGGPETVANQLDYVFASCGFHKQVSTCARNGIKDWGCSDHCRLMITVRPMGS